MPPKVSSLKKAASTQKEYKTQLGSKIEVNNNTVDVCDQIRALTAN